MKARNQDQTMAVKGKEVFVGIDVHKESWQVAVRSEGEEFFHWAEFQPFPEIKTTCPEILFSIPKSYYAPVICRGCKQ